MNHLILRPIATKEEKNTFIKEIQDAFQKSYENEFGKYDKTILPVEDIEESFNTKGAEAYIAEVNGKRVMVNSQSLLHLAHCYFCVDKKLSLLYYYKAQLLLWLSW